MDQGPGEATVLRSPAVTSPPRPTTRWFDVIGVVLLVLLGGWVALIAGAGDGRPGPVLWLLGALLLATVLARMVARSRGLVPGAVAVAITASLALTWPGMLRTGGPPTGYANTNATLAALGVVAAAAAATSSRRPGVRRGWLLLAALLAAATASVGSLAAVLVLLAAFGLLACGALRRSARVVIVGGAITVGAALVITGALAVRADGAGSAAGTLVRAELWAGAVELVEEEPLRGVGPGRFAERNPATEDTDLRWAHHEYLQIAAELGIGGLVLVLALIGWAWARLWWVAVWRPDAAALGGAAVMVVALHATVDYVFHAPAVVVAAALLAAVGDGPGRRRVARL